MKTAIELLKEIKDKDIKNKIKTGAFFLSDEQRDNLQQLLEASHNTVYTKLPSLEAVLKQFDFDRDKPVARAKQVGAITQVYDIIKRVGNFA